MGAEAVHSLQSLEFHAVEYYDMSVSETRAADSNSKAKALERLKSLRALAQQSNAVATGSGLMPLVTNRNSKTVQFPVAHAAQGEDAGLQVLESCRAGSESHCGDRRQGSQSQSGSVAMLQPALAVEAEEQQLPPVDPLLRVQCEDVLHMHQGLVLREVMPKPRTQEW